MEPGGILVKKEARESKQLSLSRVSVPNENRISQQDEIKPEDNTKKYSKSTAKDVGKDSTDTNHNGINEEDEETLLQYGNLTYVTEPQAIPTTKFVNSTLFQILKCEAEFNYMKKHTQYKCSDKPMTQEDIAGVLNLIKAPRRIVLNGELWSQGLSRFINACEDSNRLESKLEELLAKRYAKLEGICPIRRSLYEDCFDEVHRQIALESPERAILLVRCRKEIQETIEAFARLFGSTQTYNLRLSVLKNNGYQDFHDKLKAVKDETLQLVNTYESLCNEVRHLQAVNETEEAAFQKKKLGELEYLRTEHLRLQRKVDTYVEFSNAKKTEAASAKSQNLTIPSANALHSSKELNPRGTAVRFNAT